jgi:conjugal transfer pilus assembly protein TrbC
MKKMKHFILLGIALLMLVMPVQAQQPEIDAEIAEEAAESAEEAIQNIQAYEELIRQLRMSQPEWEDHQAHLPPSLQEQIPPMPGTSRPSEGENPQLMVFLTLTMPDEALRAWIDQTARAGGVVVLRGFHGNKLSTTAARIHEIRKNTDGLNGGFRIDPTAFRRLEINVAPTVVVLPRPLPPCESEGCRDDDVTSFDRIVGNTTLKHALNRLSREGDAAPDVAEWHLSKLQGEF